MERLHVHTTAGTLWNVYPMYDYAHALTDAIEGVTHSLCTLEFENHRELYDWVVRECAVPCTPRQIEFSRLNLQHAIPSKGRGCPEAATARHPGRPGGTRPSLGCPAHSGGAPPPLSPQW